MKKLAKGFFNKLLDEPIKKETTNWAPSVLVCNLKFSHWESKGARQYAFYDCDVDFNMLKECCLDGGGIPMVSVVDEDMLDPGTKVFYQAVGINEESASFKVADIYAYNHDVIICDEKGWYYYTEVV